MIMKIANLKRRRHLLHERVRLNKPNFFCFETFTDSAVSIQDVRHDALASHGQHPGPPFCDHDVRRHLVEHVHLRLRHESILLRPGLARVDRVS